MGYTEIVAIFIAVLLVIITYFKWAFTFWEKRNVPGIKPTIPFGNLENLFIRKDSPAISIKNMYLQLKSKGYQHAGYYMFSRPEYMPIDPEFVKNILQKDFQYFTERGFYYNEKDDPFSANLFTIGGHKWRNLRTKLTPTFTSGKIKMMFDTLIQCGNQMLEAMDNYHQNIEAIDIKDVLSRYSTDVIGSCAFGVECNSFKSPDAEFRKYGKQIFAPLSKLHNAWLLIAIMKPNLGRLLKIRLFPKETTDFFGNVIKETLTYRETNGIDRNDMLKLLIDLKNSGNGNGLTFEEIGAQAFIFFFAGFETSSATMSFCLFELAKHPDIQEKVRNEVNHVLKKFDGRMCYEAIMDMKYMNQVIDESLRKYPPAPVIGRQCGEDYQVPNTDAIIPKGTMALIPILGLHHDPEYYPEPDKFDPERFSEENKQQRHPFTFIPFGEGPRICIGLRFGLMQIKVGLVLLLKNYKFSLNTKTADPIVLNPYGFILTPQTEILLDTEKVQ